MRTVSGILIWLRAPLTGVLLAAVAGCGTLSLNQPPPNVTPRFVYATDASAGQVLGFSVNNSGTLSPIGSFNVGTGPMAISGDVTGAIVYVANTDGAVSGFIVNSTSGFLQPVSGTFVAGTHPVGIATDPEDRFVYVANAGSNDVSAFSETAATGVLTALPATSPTSGTPVRIIIDPSGRFVYVAAGSAGTDVFIINGNASLTLQQNVPPANTAATAIAVEPHLRYAYTANGPSGVTAYQVNSTTGKLTALSGATFVSGTAPVAIAVDPSGTYLYVANSGSSDIAAFLINSNGFLTPIGTNQTLPSAPVDLVADPSGKFLYALTSIGIAGFTIGNSGTLSPASTTTAGTNLTAVTVLP